MRRPPWMRVTGCLLALLFLLAAAAIADDVPTFYRGTLTDKHNLLRGVATVATSRARETDVAVVLARNCLECHNATDRKGGLDLTRREQALNGGDSGEVLKLGDPEMSLLVKRVEAGEMPPKGRDKLTAEDYQVTAIGNAAIKTAPQTIVYYTSPDQSDAAAKVAAIINAKTSSPLPDSEKSTAANLLIVLGLDAE